MISINQSPCLESQILSTFDRASVRLAERPLDFMKYMRLRIAELTLGCTQGTLRSAGMMLDLTRSS